MVAVMQENVSGGQAQHVVEVHVDRYFDVDCSIGNLAMFPDRCEGGMKGRTNGRAKYVRASRCGGVLSLIVKRVGQT